MNGHEKACRCLECLANIVDEIATRVIDWQIKASWHGWPIDENGPYMGWQPWLPVIPHRSWFLQFRQDAPRREMIRAVAEVVNEAERLIKRT